MQHKSEFETEFETLRFSTSGTVATVELNRVAARNAMNLRMCEEVFAVFDRLRFDDTLRAVVIRNAGDCFCAGVDIKEMHDKPVAWARQRRHRGLDAFLAIERCPLPVICVANGPVIGAGCEIAAASDFVIASDASWFQWPEALRGGVGATQRLPRIVGRAMAKDLLFTGRKLPVAEAQALRFVNRIVPAGQLDAALSETLEGLLRAGPIAVRLIKQAINTGENCDRTTAIDIERQLIDQSFAHNEWRSAIEDFAAKGRS